MTERQEVKFHYHWLGNDACRIPRIPVLSHRVDDPFRAVYSDSSNLP